LLFNMEKYDIALSKALESGDTDLAYDVIMKLRSSKPPNWFETIRRKPAAMSLLLNLLKTNDQPMLEEFLRTSEMYPELAEHYARKAYEAGNPEEMSKILGSAKEQFALAQQRDSTYAFAVRATQDEMNLVLAQRDKELSTGKTLCGQPLADTVRELLIIGDQKSAAKLRSDFKMSEKKYWWLRVQAIAANSKTDVMAYNQLERLAKEKKSPIGYEPFAEVCIDGGVNEEALKYISMIPDFGRRIPYLVRIGRFRDAVDCALKTKDPLSYARQILPACKKPEDRQMVESMFQQAAK